MVSPEALTQCCNTATAIIYENIKTKNKSTIYKEALQEGEGSGDDQYGGSAWDAALNQALSGAVEMVDLLDNLQDVDKGNQKGGEKGRGHHYIYVLTNTVSWLRLRTFVRLSCAGFAEY